MTWTTTCRYDCLILELQSKRGYSGAIDDIQSINS